MTNAENNYLTREDLYINDFHRQSSMAALREVQHMSLHPYSRQQKLEQIKALKEASMTSKTKSNTERTKKA